MITFIRTASVAPGKTADALSFSQHVVALVKDKFGVQISSSTPIGGNPNRIAWVSTYASLAAFEETSTKLLSDPGYLSLVAAGVSNFLPGSLHDEIWRSL